MVEMTRLVSETLKLTRPDVVIASTTGMAHYALMAGQGIRVMEEHNAWSRSAWERYRRERGLVGRLRHWASWQKRSRYEARLYRHFDLCTMVSDEDRAATLRLLPRYQGRVEVVPNGVDCQHNRPGLAAPRTHALVFNGALTYSANYDAVRYFLADIYPLIRQRAPDASLIITGSTAGVDLSGLALDGTVHLTGYVNDVRYPVAGASVCVVPIRQGGGTRLKILEAMALGTPVVATCKGAEGLAVTPGREILIADEPEEFATEVVRLLRDPALREHLAGNARQLVEEKYDWPAIGQRFTALVEALVQERASP